MNKRNLFGVKFAASLIGITVLTGVVENTVTLYHMNDKLIQELSTEREKHKSSVNTWSDSYESLQEDYIEKCIENDSLKEELSRFEIPSYGFSSDEIMVLARCVQCEHGSSSSAQKYITKVILNRLVSEEYPDTVRDVIYQKINGVPQFSPAYDGSMDSCELRSETLANVYSVIVHGCDLPEYVQYFYSESLQEDNWVKSLKTYDIVDGVIFCYDEKED